MKAATGAEAAAALVDAAATAAVAAAATKAVIVYVTTTKDSPAEMPLLGPSHTPWWQFWPCIKGDKYLIDETRVPLLGATVG